MAGRVSGICYIKVDGSQLEVKGGIETPIARTAKEAVMGLSGNAGYKETIQRQFLKLSAIFTNDFPINTIMQGTNMTLTAELANGRVYTLSNAWLEGEAMANGEEGTLELEFTGITGTWQ